MNDYTSRIPAYVDGGNLVRLGIVYSKETVVKFVEEHHTRVLGLANSERLIKELKIQWERLSLTDRKNASQLEAQLLRLESQYRIDRTALDIHEIAWSELSPTDQIILATYHQKGLTRTEAVAELSIELNCSETTIRRNYNKALKRFGILLG